MSASTNGAAQPQDLPWPSDIELEIRGQLKDVEAHQLRTDRLVTALQLEGRQLQRETTEKIEAVGAKVEELVRLVRLGLSNGHGPAAPDEPIGGSDV